MAIVGGNIEQKNLGLPINLTGTHAGTEIDPVTGYLQLKIKEVSANLTNIYESEGTWTSDVIDLEDNFLDYGKVFTTDVSNGSSSIAVETRTSDDGATWEDWTAVAMDGTIQSVKKQRIQIRIKLFAGFQTDVYLISDFDNVADVDLLTPKDFIETSNGLRLKRDYEFDMTIDTAWTGEGSLHRKQAMRDEWLRIDKINMSSEGAPMSDVSRNILSRKIFSKSTAYKGSVISSTPLITDGVTTGTSYATLEPSRHYYHVLDKEYDIESYTFIVNSGNSSSYQINFYDKNDLLLSSINPTIGGGVPTPKALRNVNGISIENIRGINNRILELVVNGKYSEIAITNKSLILHDGEYKKIEKYNYNTKLDTTVSANSKLTNYFRFDEASGNVTDSKGSAVGTVTGATRVTGYNNRGSALNFSNGNNVVFSSKFIPMGKKSIRFKFKKNTLPTTVESILNDSFVTNSTSTYGNLIGVNETGGLFWILYNGFRATSRTINLFSNLNICDNRWHDILLTWDGTTSANAVKIYIDDMKNPNVTQTATALETTIQSNNLIIGKTLDTNYPYPLICEMDNLEIYNNVLIEAELFSISTSWESVSTTLPSSEQFLEDGLDTLSPLLDRGVETLNPLPMIDKSEILPAGEVGKVFSKTVNLKKYLDIRKIKVEV